MWPVLFELEVFVAHLAVTSYGVLAMLGAFVGVSLAVHLAPAHRLSRFDVFAASSIAVAAGALGAKLLFVAVSFERLAGLDATSLASASGGLVWYGGVIAGGAAALAYLKAYRIDPLRALDAMAPGVALGHAIGRVGCVLAGCCYGRPTGLPWGVRYPAGPIFEGPSGVPLHPVQLYEAAAEIALVLVTASLAGRARRGALAAVWLLGYAAARVALEPLRGDDRGVAILGLPVSVPIALGLACVALALLSGSRRLTTETKVS